MINLSPKFRVAAGLLLALFLTGAWARFQISRGELIFSPPRLIREPNGSYSYQGSASWYSRNSPGINPRTANNEIFNDQAFTCAMWGTEFNRKVRVTNLKNGRTVILRVNDRGPAGNYFLRGRVIDITEAAFHSLTDTRRGIIPVKVEVL